MSRTLPDQRLTESAALASPTNAVTLADPDRFTFAFVGDLHLAGGDSARWKQILQAAQAEGDSFVVALGDIADEGEAKDYEAYNQAVIDVGLQGKVFSVIGNHDIFHDGWVNYRAKLGPSFYGLDIGNTRLIALDTADGTLSSTQIDWLSGQLKAANGKAILASHYLPVVPGIETYLKLPSITESLSVMRLAQNHSVRAWIGGHFHGYAQSTIGGVPYVVAGGGGGRRMGPFSEYFFVQAQVAPEGIQFVVRKL